MLKITAALLCFAITAVPVAPQTPASGQRSTLSGNMLRGYQQPAPPKKGDDPRSVVDQFVNAYRTRDVDRLVNLLADNVVFDDPTFRLHQEGRDAIRKMATGTFAAFNDITIDVHSVVTMGDTVATEQTVAGVVTHPERAKRNIKVRGASFFRVRDGQIYRWTDYFDFQTFSEQTRQGT